MTGPAEAIGTYIAAKDGNRPWLMHRAFAPDATLEMEVRSDAISFPSSASGLEAITDVLVRRFSRENENVYTYCLCDPPGPTLGAFGCDWLVAMSRPDSRDLRVGCGRYDWRVAADRALVRHLKITIEAMEVLAPATLHPVMEWLGALPYPWCPAATAAAGIPPLRDLRSIAEYLERCRDAGGAG